MWADSPVLWVNWLLDARTLYSDPSETSDSFEVAAILANRGHKTLPSAITRIGYRPDVLQKLTQ
ncbi:hypothetical protein ACUXAV_000147 [Cupriavidus metallidurans]|jgi:hypothetical protein|uniref:Uncharacterized protein n=1 Tax=Cupriavidus metallidurans (strain ATCC 43123 / DSM 2839 / NBRC 102507 / CH34) TaxID=266264 RepID=D3DXS9_CUPMC|nr:hypothetical protein Rmet_6491 [Cupriavidus metallidurans CH34]KWW37936.1 hypothetical protein AU374_01715 [Cupriavidus metallidurans]